MSRTTGSRSSGHRECTVCAHPGLIEVNAMVLNGTNYGDIIDRMMVVHPTAPQLSKQSLTRHKANHLLNQPITVSEVGEDGTTVERTTYVTGVIRSETLQIPEEALKVIPPTLKQALDLIITAGVLNVLNNPAMVGQKMLTDALALREKMGDHQAEGEEFEKAWTDEEFLSKKNKLKANVKKKRVVRRSVTLEETEDVSEGNTENGIIEGEVRYQLEDTLDADELDNASIPNPTAVAGVGAERTAN